MNKEIVIIMIHYVQESFFLHKKEINKLIGETKETGYALVPLKFI